MTDNTLSLLSAPPVAPRLLDQVRDRIRVKHFSLRTEQAYVAWIRRYILFHGKRHRGEMGKLEAEAFLTALAVERDVAAATPSPFLLPDAAWVAPATVSLGEGAPSVFLLGSPPPTRGVARRVRRPGPPAR